MGLEGEISGYHLQSFNFKLADYFLKRITPYCKGRTLDLGCGIGVFTKKLTSLGLDVLGVDGSEGKIEAAKKNVPHVKFKVSLFEEYVPGVLFDTVIAKNVLEHLTDDGSRKLISNIYSWLNPHGKFIAYVPNALGIHRKIGYYMGYSKSFGEETKDGVALGHIQSWTRQKLELDLNAAGFKILESKGLFLKPFPNRMMELINDKICNALFEVANDPMLADLCSGIYIVGER